MNVPIGAKGRIIEVLSLNGKGVPAVNQVQAANRYTRVAGRPYRSRKAPIAASIPASPALIVSANAPPIWA